MTSATFYVVALSAQRSMADDRVMVAESAENPSAERTEVAPPQERPLRLTALSPQASIADMLVNAFATAGGIDPDEHYCLAQAIYFEARSEPVEGQLAVAHVVLNRVSDSRYPDDICSVVFQNEDWRHRCQFSFACDGRPDRPFEAAPWRMAQEIALLTYVGYLSDITDSATHYHANYVEPYWMNALEPTAEFGLHRFYREAGFTKPKFTDADDAQVVELASP